MWVNLINFMVLGLVLGMDYPEHKIEPIPKQFWTKWCEDEHFCNIGGIKYAHTLCVYHFKDDNVNITITKEKKQSILDLHNYIRNNVTKLTKYTHIKLHPAANMRLMTWDYELENLATKAAQKGMLDLPDYCRNTEKFKEIGQIRFHDYSDDILVDAVTMIEDRFSILIPYGKSEIRELHETNIIGDFAQILWAETYKIGCSEVLRTQLWSKKKYLKLVFCNYGPSGNHIHQSIYQIGDPCTKCPEFTACRPGLYPNLCSSHDDDTEISMAARIVPINCFKLVFYLCSTIFTLAINNYFNHFII